MPYQINIFNIKTNGLNSNANIDIGPTIHNSHTANSKFYGANIAFGDLSPNSSCMANCVGDFDISDQDQIANPSGSVNNMI
ncbi:spore germination protein [Bacillus aquiflavi]|uniref:spore germination protein n=1 Tax=Bacillus aquiflavi TaxID=2672567 RepID=UPI001CA934C3|nr:spore germination protein [Bacillus aquiflavi]UAC49872.1 spore germination protein [Bacillus aquiflavi]